MKKSLFGKIQQIIFVTTLCIGVLLALLGNSTKVLAESTSGQENTTETQNYTINLHDATKVGDTYWFTKDKTIRIAAAADYFVFTSQDGPWVDSLTYTYSNALPEAIYLNKDDTISDAILLNIAWDGDTPKALFMPGSTDYVGFLISPIENKVPTRENSFTIEAIDENGSGVKSVQYYVADGELTDTNVDYTQAIQQIEEAVGNDWTFAEGTSASGTLPYYGPNVIYAKITDNAGNEVYLNSTGIVLFDQPSVNATSIEYTKQGTENPTFEVDLKGNMFQDDDIILKDASGNVVDGFTPREDENDISWGYTNGDGVITLNREFLDNLSMKGMEANYTVTINYMPLTEQYPNLETSSVYMEINPSEIELTVKLDWGEADTRADNVVQYVNNAGKTSVEVASSNLDDDILWLSETSGGATAWYGMDLSENAFDLDKTHRFYVQWLEASEAEYTRSFDQIDASVRNSVDTTNNWIFKIGVEEADGEKIQPSNGKVEIYVQLDDSWDKDKVKAYAIDTNEQIKVSFEEKTAPSGGTGNYAVLELNHFSPYIIYQQKEVASTPPVTNTPTYYYPIYNIPPVTEPETTETTSNEAEDSKSTTSKPKDNEAVDSGQEKNETVSREDLDTDSTKEEPIKSESEDNDSTNMSQIENDSTETNSQIKEGGLGIGMYLLIAIGITLLLFIWVIYKKKK